MATSDQFFYIVQPGDTPSGICKHATGSLLSGNPAERMKKVLEYNPQITNPNMLRPGDMIRLGSSSYPLESIFENDMAEMRAIWNRSSPAAREIVQKNFDILDWMSDQKDKLDYLENVGWQGKPLMEAVPELSYGVVPAEYRKLSVALRELRIVRGNTIMSLKRYSLSVTRVPILLITASSNGFYGYAQKLLRMVEWAEKIQLGKKLLFFEIGVEAAKVARTAIETQDLNKTANQVYSGAFKVAVGAGATAGASKICGITIKRGPSGWAVCALAFGVAIVGGNKLASIANETIMGKPIDTNLPVLP